MITKVIRDGKVAVLYSPGYGTAFRINKYDGHESIEYFSIDNFFVA